VQPQEPTTGPVPPQPGVFVPAQALGGPPGAVPPAAGTGVGPVGKRPNQRKRLWIAMVGGIMVLLCLGGVGVAVSLYDEATKIDRTQPDTVTDSFLIAYLVNRDDKQARLFTCDAPNLANIGALREQLVAREKDFDVKVSVSWGALDRAAAGKGQEDVTTQLTISGSSGGQLGSSRNEDWRFRVVDDGGNWRVCDASKIS
jgi:hypothetical protein